MNKQIEELAYIAAVAADKNVCNQHSFNAGRKSVLAELAKQSEPVAEAEVMPGASGFTMVCFKASDVPVGTKIYTPPLPQPDLVAEIERLGSEYETLNKTTGNVICELRQQLSAAQAELADREGMVCGDCNDTGWLENRVEGRHPCTCMTEAEPYQLLEQQLKAAQAEIALLERERADLKQGMSDNGVSAVWDTQGFVFVINTLADSLQQDNEQLWAALNIAHEFCLSLSADECPDSVALPIRDAIAAHKARQGKV